MIVTILAGLSLVVWLGLVLARGMFWRIGPVDAPPAADGDEWPDVIAIVPARNEQDVIERAVDSLLTQDYRGRFAIRVVDDQSEDATAAIVSRLAAASGGRLRLVSGSGPAPGWTGKLHAMQQGLDALAAEASAPDYFWFTDADIVHGPGVLADLVATARARKAVLVSRMAELRCQSPAERWLVPAFVFFFRMLYPFALVNDPRRRTAGAAGGCMLVARPALEGAGGLATIRGALIDDCALGAILKKQGSVHLALSHEVRSIRPYPRLTDIADMVVRSAYAQLRYSPLGLAGTVLGMALVYLAPPVIAIGGHGAARWLALAAYILMVLVYVPMLRFYRLSPLRALALPLIAGLYTLFTLDSALRHMMARGGAWKGRLQAPAGAGRPQ